MDAVQIGIAVVEFEGCYLVGYRGSGQVLAGKAEFPGGKCESGESPEACAVRECQEETGLVVSAEQQLQQVVFEYDHGTVALHFWLCHPVEPECEPGGEFRWIAAEKLRDLPFPEGNSSVLELLANSDN